MIGNNINIVFSLSIIVTQNIVVVSQYLPSLDLGQKNRKLLICVNCMYNSVTYKTYICHCIAYPLFVNTLHRNLAHF